MSGRAAQGSGWSLPFPANIPNVVDFSHGSHSWWFRTHARKKPGSVPRACDSEPWGREFEPHAGRRVYLIKKVKIIKKKK